MSCSAEVGPMVPWSAFHDYASIYANKISPDVLDMLLRAATIEMARETLLIQKDIYVDVQDGVLDYSIEVSDDYTVHMVREVVLEGHWTIKQWPRAGSVPLNHYHYYQPDQLLLGSAPSRDCDGGLMVRAVVIPSQRSCGVERWVYDKYGEDVAGGALSRAFLMKDTPWYNTRDGGIWLRRWKTQISRIKSEQGKGGIAGPTYMKARRFI